MGLVAYKLQYHHRVYHIGFLNDYSCSPGYFRKADNVYLHVHTIIHYLNVPSLKDKKLSGLCRFLIFIICDFLEMIVDLFHVSFLGDIQSFFFLFLRWWPLKSRKHILSCYLTRERTDKFVPSPRV